MSAPTVGRSLRLTSPQRRVLLKWAAATGLLAAVERNLALAQTANLGSQILHLVREHTGRIVDAARQARQASRDEGWHHPVIDEIAALAERRAARIV